MYYPVPPDVELAFSSSFSLISNIAIFGTTGLQSLLCVLTFTIRNILCFPGWNARPLCQLLRNSFKSALKAMAPILISFRFSHHFDLLVSVGKYSFIHLE